MVFNPGALWAHSTSSREARGTFFHRPGYLFARDHRLAVPWGLVAVSARDSSRACFLVLRRCTSSRFKSPNTFESHFKVFQTCWTLVRGDLFRRQDTQEVADINLTSWDSCETPFSQTFVGQAVLP